MFISLDEKFTDESGNTYQVASPTDDGYITYLYDETGNKVIARSDESEDFPKFYARDWTKQECHNDLKADWVIQKDRQFHIWDLQELIWDLEEASGTDEHSWLNLETWETLPTERAFREWLENDFRKIWDTIEDEKNINEETAGKLTASVKRLTDAMADDSSLIQAVR